MVRHDVNGDSAKVNRPGGIRTPDEGIMKPPALTAELQARVSLYTEELQSVLLGLFELRNTVMALVADGHSNGYS